MPEIALSINVSLSTIEKLLAKLKKEKILQRKGARKVGVWEISKQ